MKKKFFILLSFLLFVVIGIILNPRDKQPATAAVAPDIGNTTLPQEMTTNVENKSEMKQKTTATKIPKITSEEINSFHKLAPDEEQVTNDKRTNPHTPSKSLMTFAKQLGPLMEKSYKSESNANILIPELKSCALDETVAKAARALCVQDTEELSQYYPQLKQKASELRANVSPEVKKILDINDAFIKK